MPGFADYKNMNHLRVKSKIENAFASAVGRVHHCATAPPVRTLVSSKHEPQETTGKAYNIS